MGQAMRLLHPRLVYRIGAIGVAPAPGSLHSPRLAQHHDIAVSSRLFLETRSCHRLDRRIRSQRHSSHDGRSVSFSEHPPAEPLRTVRRQVRRPAHPRSRIEGPPRPNGRGRMWSCRLHSGRRSLPGSRSPIKLGEVDQGHGAAWNSRPTKRPTVRVPSTSMRTNRLCEPGIGSQ